jgi:hypothetical protein
VDEGQRNLSNEDSHGADRNCDKLYTKKRAVPSLEYKLTSYAAWWRRAEREERMFFKEVRKEEETRRKTANEDRKRRKILCPNSSPILKTLMAEDLT